MYQNPSYWSSSQFYTNKANSEAPAWMGLGFVLAAHQFFGSLCMSTMTCIYLSLLIYVIYIYIFIDSYIYIYIHVSICMCICIYTYIYLYNYD